MYLSLDYKILEVVNKVDNTVDTFNLKFSYVDVDALSNTVKKTFQTVEQSSIKGFPYHLTNG